MGTYLSIAYVIVCLWICLLIGWFICLFWLWIWLRLKLKFWLVSVIQKLVRFRCIPKSKTVNWRYEKENRERYGCVVVCACDILYAIFCVCVCVCVCVWWYNREWNRSANEKFQDFVVKLISPWVYCTVISTINFF